MMLPLALLAASVQLSPETAARLTVAWRYDAKVTPPNKHAARIAAFEATPVMANGMVYLTTPFTQVIALDPATGAERWVFDPHVADRNYSEAASRGVAVKAGTVFLGTLDARVIALRGRDGHKLWEAPIGGDGYQLTSAPVVAGSTVIVGSSLGDNGRAEMERGTVTGFDARSGKQKWRWDATPPGKTGAANAWAPMSVDEARDMVFVPTGSASPDFYGGLRPGDNRHANSVVALRASTGEVLWAFQVVHHDLWDYDVASRPTLVEVAGKPAVAVVTKIGHYFLLDRLTGKPLLPVEERPVPKSDIEGEQAWPTQPFPVSGGVFTSQKFEPRPGWCTEQFRELRYEGVFTPPSLNGTLLFPGNVGGANWGSASYDAGRGLLFVAANQLATAVRLIPRAQFDAANHGETGERWGQEYAGQAGTPFGMARRTFLDPEGRPCNRQPWGALAAIDVASGKVKWEAPMLVSLGGPTAVSGVVFFGGTVFETKLRAYAADDGRKVWETELPFSAHSVPGSYEWKRRHYVVVCAGGHGKVDGSKLGMAVIAYAVPD
jgi:quinoprotein glucose dehydrogenase